MKPMMKLSSQNHKLKYSFATHFTTVSLLSTTSQKFDKEEFILLVTKAHKVL